MLNPDYGLDLFVDEEYHKIRNLCPIVSLYGDKVRSHCSLANNDRFCRKTRLSSSLSVSISLSLLGVALGH